MGAQAAYYWLPLMKDADLEAGIILFLITILVVLMAEIFLLTSVRPTQTACAFTKNISIQHKMSVS